MGAKSYESGEMATRTLTKDPFYVIVTVPYTYIPTAVFDNANLPISNIIYNHVQQ